MNTTDTGHETTLNPGQHRFRGCMHRPTRSGRVMGGIVVIAAGAALLARQVGVELPAWLFTWEMFLITIGIYIGAKHNFSRGGWFIPIIIGALFLADDVYPDMRLGDLFWPIVIIVAGLCMVLIPRNKNRTYWRMPETRPLESGEDMIDSTAVFGSVKKNIISKNFKGGEVTCVFGGAEINLSQADINGRVALGMTQIFGGAKLIVPPHWTIHSEMTAVLGGIEDKRPLQKDIEPDPDKVLVIDGTTVIGGIEISSY